MRPQLISIICLIGILGAALNVFFAVWSDTYATDYRIWLMVLACVQIKAIQGIWNMKKWGVTLFAANLALVQISAMMAGAWSPIQLFGPVVMMLVLSKYYSEMK